MADDTVEHLDYDYDKSQTDSENSQLFKIEKSNKIKLTENSDSEESQSIKYDIISNEESIKVAPTKQPAKKQVSISDVVTVYDKDKTNPVTDPRVTKSEIPIVYTEVTTTE